MTSLIRWSKRRIQKESFFWILKWNAWELLILLESKMVRIVRILYKALVIPMVEIVPIQGALVLVLRIREAVRISQTL